MNRPDSGQNKEEVTSLSVDLKREFPGVGGFSVQNLWYMRQFYQEYHDSVNLQPMVGEIGWMQTLPKTLKGRLPTPKEIAKLLEDL